MTAREHPDPQQVLTDEQRALLWELRSIAYVILQAIEVADVDAARRAFTDGLETIEAAT